MEAKYAIEEGHTERVLFGRAIKYDDDLRHHSPSPF